MVRRIRLLRADSSTVCEPCRIRAALNVALGVHSLCQSETRPEVMLNASAAHLAGQQQRCCAVCLLF